MAGYVLPIKWNEDNRAKWVGTRPGYSGEHISSYSSVTNGVINMYTVPPAKMLLLFNDRISIAQQIAGLGEGILQIYDTVPARIYRIHRISAFNAGSNESESYCRDLPYPVPAGYYIQLQSIGASLIANGGFEGVLIDV